MVKLMTVVDGFDNIIWSARAVWVKITTRSNLAIDATLSLTAEAAVIPSFATQGRGTINS